VFITAKQFNQNPTTRFSSTHRLAVRDVPPGGSSSGTQNKQHMDESPGGSSSFARRLLENFQKLENSIDRGNIHAFHTIHHAIHA